MSASGPGPKCRNIDSILKDAVIKDATPPMSSGLIPIPLEVGVVVWMDPVLEHQRMGVVVTNIAQDTLKGTVKHGYFPSEQSEQIDVGAMVQFSRKKVVNISSHGILTRAVP